MDSELKTLIGKLNPTCRQGLEAAAGLCVSQTNYNVEIEHFLLKLLEAPDTDLQRLLRYYEISAPAVVKELTDAMDRLKRGNQRTPTLSPHIPKLLQEAWLTSSLNFKSPQVRSGALLVALLDTDFFRGIVLESCQELGRIPREAFRHDAREIVQGSSEDNGAPEPAPTAPQTQKSAQDAPDASKTKKATPQQTPNLDQYTVDLTNEARLGKIDPVTGRDFEIRQVVDILTRRRQNNPILTGEAGVGKTAVVEGFALRIITGDVPGPLKNISLRVLDLGLLQAGAGIKGEFENRLKGVIREVNQSPQPIILFIDEAHTMIGAGAATGNQGDAANLLKPALARGELRTIAATTWSEYKKYFEKDPALTRRFQVVKVEEPDEPTCIEMLRGTVKHLERHHGVRILSEAIHDAVCLSNRYITGRQLPDKAVSVLDTASARVALAQNATPPQVEDVERQIQQAQLELQILEREQSTGHNHQARIRELNRTLKRAETEQARIVKQWKTELSLVREINAVQTEIEEKTQSGKKGPPSLKSLNTKLSRLRSRLGKAQGEDAMVSVWVDSNAITGVISGWTGIPVGKIMTDDIQQALTLEDKLGERVVGQPDALNAIARRIKTSKASLEDPGKPVGVFLLVGPSGVGKTETAHALAEVLFGGDKNMVRVNMSEYQEAHTVSGLKGSPPGYVGFGQGGVLTEAVRRTPYTVVLLDEIEKAHPDVMEIFFQVFDKGLLEDAEGVEVNFKNTVILLTSNVGTDLIMDTCDRSGRTTDSAELSDLLKPELLKHFPPAFLGRLVVVPYLPLGKSQLQDITQLKLGKIKERFSQNHRASLTFDKELVQHIAAQCTENSSGARTIDNILTQSLLPELSREVLNTMAESRPLTHVRVALDKQGGYKFKLKG